MRPKLAPTDSTSINVVVRRRTLYAPSYADPDPSRPYICIHSPGRSPDAVVFNAMVRILFVLTILCIEKFIAPGRSVDHWFNTRTHPVDDVVVAVPIIVVYVFVPVTVKEVVTV